MDQLQRSGMFRGEVNSAGKASGYGIWTGDYGGEARGTFSENRRHGVCQVTDPNGDIKIGEYRYGKLQGKLTFISKRSGCIYNQTYQSNIYVQDS